MANLNFPLSGNVRQAISPWSDWFKTMGSQLGLININLTSSANPAMEAEIVTDVASYGRQLGRMQDALAVLLAHLPPDLQLPPREQAAIDDFKGMFNEIARVKDRHPAPGGRRALRFRTLPTAELET